MKTIINREQKYEILKKELLEHSTLLKSETYGLEKINFESIIDIQDIINLILEDERKNIHLLKYIDLKNITFENQNVEEINFTNTNAIINPQKVKNKSLKNTILNGLDFKNKSFKGVNIEGTNFTNAKNVNLDPQKIKNKSLRYTILDGIDFKNKSFDNVNVQHTNFTNAKNVNLDPQKIEYSSLYGATLNGIDFRGKSFKNISIFKADFRGAKNVRILKQEIWARATMEQPGEKNNYPNLPIFDENVEIIDQEQEALNFQKRLSCHILKNAPKCY